MDDSSWSRPADEGRRVETGAAPRADHERRLEQTLALTRKLLELELQVERTRTKLKELLDEPREQHDNRPEPAVVYRIALLFSQEPERVFTTKEVVNSFPAEPENSVRSLLARLAREQRIVKLGRGRYRALLSAPVNG